MSIVDNAMKIRHEARLKRAACVREAIACLQLAIACLQLAQEDIRDACEKIAQAMAAVPDYALAEELRRLDSVEYEFSVATLVEARIDGLKEVLREPDGRSDI